MKPCRCGTPAEKNCHLCKEPLCLWHVAEQPVLLAVDANGRRHQEFMPVCFPSCTSSFGLPEQAEKLDQEPTT